MQIIEISSNIGRLPEFARSPILGSRQKSQIPGSWKGAAGTLIDHFIRGKWCFSPLQPRCVRVSTFWIPPP